jgi:PAS domain S-box-containing protein
VTRRDAPRIFTLRPRGRGSSPLRRLLIASVVWLGAFACTAAAAPHLRHPSFGFFWMAVLFAAWYAGLGAALLAAVGAVLAMNSAQLRGQDPGALGGDLLTFGIFVAASTVVSFLAARLSSTASALGESESQFRTLAEVAPVGIVIANPDFETAYVNPRALEIAGLRAGELTIDRWQSLVHPDDREAVLRDQAPFRAGLASEYTNEFRIVRGDGEQRWIRTVSRWVRGEKGHRLGLVMTVDDVTRERHLETRLQQSQRMEAVGQLAGGIAHDFNNLLTVIMGNLEFLRDEMPTGHPAHQDIAHISSAAERARALVKQLLAFGRRQMLQPRVVNVNDALRQAERWFGRVLGDEIECRVGVDDARPLLVRVDPTQLDQILLNLAVNARDAMLTARHGHHGLGGTLRFDADHLELTAANAAEWAPLAPGRYVRITARDTGHGMDASTRARVFEPFFTTKDVGAGTGLGLATVEGIVAQSGGAIHVDSAPGKGTTFTMLFPEVVSPEQADDAAEPASRPAGGRGLVLVVEDDRTVRRTTRRMLVRAGYTVFEAANGAEALQRWGDRAHELHAVVTDMRMPAMGGAELARGMRLRAPNLPFIFVSGFNEELDTMHDGIDVFLEKPFSREALLEALAAHSAA